MAVTAEFAEFLDQIRTRIPVSTVVGARVKLTRKGNRFWGCCPFHKEKTPSFTVLDEREFYHCFGCSAHGDVVSFVMQTQGVTFMEAVTQLSAQAGLQMPAISPERQGQGQWQRQQQHRLSLYEVCETACDFFQKNLQSQVGQRAMSYLKNRGVSDADIGYFRLGYSPDSPAFLSYMDDKNIEHQALIDTGLVRRGDNGIYAFFRNRLMFPITDTRGRVVAFGGRFMGEAKIGKYINSPQGTLYDKSRVLYNLKNARESAALKTDIAAIAVLYNLKNARESAYKQNRLIVCEGYMDVIALSGAGFGNAVAPCGTAMTEDQLLQCWKTVDEPILCFDGDTAGKRAAFSTCERALPLLTAGKSVNIAIMPTGQDPDDIIRSQGAAVMGDILDKAVPLRDFLWNHAVQSFATDTPERLAKMEKQLFVWASFIGDKGLASIYRNSFKKLVWDNFKRHRTPPLMRSNPDILQSINLSEQAQKILLACFINHPKVLATYAEQCIGFFTPPYKQYFQIAYDGVCDGVDTAEQMYAHLTDNGQREILSTVCDRNIYMLAKKASPPQADDADTEHFVQGVLVQYNDDKVRKHTEQQAKYHVENDQMEQAEKIGADYRTTTIV